MASTTNPVKILEVCQFPPFSNSPKAATESSLPLTFFDTFWFKFPPVERIFFYELTELTPALFHSVILPKLERSLSLTLLHFLPLAGNITWPPHADKPIILYTPNDGVPLTIGESAGDFYCLSGNKAREAIDSLGYVPELPISDSKASVMALQITLFPNQGFCIGISSHHAILDGKSTTMFMKAWAHTCKYSEPSSILPPELTPFFDREVIEDPEGLEMEYLNNWLELKWPGVDTGGRSLKVLAFVAPPELVRATLELSREDIKKLREKIQHFLSEKVPKEDSNQSTIHLSTFVVTVAYIFVCIIKSKELQKEREVLIGFTADCRARLDPPIPANYFGNCVTAGLAMTEAGDLVEENGVMVAAEKLSEAIKRLEKGVLEGAKTKLINFMTIAVGAETLTIAGSPRFNVYEADFGWGKPVKVEITSIDRTGAISMAESRDGSGGVEIGLVLKKHEMEKFDSMFVNGLKDL